MLLLGNVVDEFLNKYRLSHTGTTEQTDFTTFAIRLQQINHFDARVEHFLCRGQIFEFWGSR